MSALGMSDEDFLNADHHVEPEQEQEEIQEEPEALEEPTEQEESEEGEYALEEAEEGLEEDEEAPEDETVADAEDSGDTSENAGEEEAEEGDAPDADLEQLRAILEPFNANGKSMQVRSAEEAIQLMQFGANYTKKMQALKPTLKISKMLEQQGLMDVDKLNYLIALDKKDPAAIAKLVKDSGIDPYELNQEEEEGKQYVPKDHSVSDTTMQLEEVLSSIENTPSYSKCLDVIGNQWDDASENILISDPSMIVHLNNHIANGTFDQVNQEVERQRMLGGLNGLSDFEAYKQVGTSLVETGQLAGKAKPPVKPVARSPLPNTAAKSTRSEKRKAASAPKRSPSVEQKDDFNPLSMSDEAFEKLMNQHNV